MNEHQTNPKCLWKEKRGNSHELPAIFVGLGRIFGARALSDGHGILPPVEMFFILQNLHISKCMKLKVWFHTCHATLISTCNY